MKTKANKEVLSAGYCIIRPDILKQRLKVCVGFNGRLSTDKDDAIPYRWLKEDEGFQVLIHGRWEDAESIDFNFLSGEKEIFVNTFKNYDYSDAMEEIKDWSVKDLKQILRHCGYKTYVKDIMVQMVRDLARVHAWKIQIEHNPFLVK